MSGKSPVIGIIMGTAGSIGINTGMNIQSLGVHRLPEEHRNEPWRSKIWVIGLLVFLISTVFNFLALMFAAASILVPIESIQLVTNVIFNWLVNKAHVSKRLACGSILAVVGTLAVVCSGPTEPYRMGVEEALETWSNWEWWSYLFLSMALTTLCEVKFHFNEKGYAEGKKVFMYELAQPVLFSTSSAITGAAQSVIHAKVVSELVFDAGAHPDVRPKCWQHWIFYMEILLLAVSGGWWIVRQNQGLVKYDPLLIIPLLQALYIVFAASGSGIFFREFWRLHKGPFGYAGWAVFLGGIACVVTGLYFVCPEQTEMHPPVRDQRIAPPEEDCTRCGVVTDDSGGVSKASLEDATQGLTSPEVRVHMRRSLSIPLSQATLFQRGVDSLASRLSSLPKANEKEAPVVRGIGPPRDAPTISEPIKESALDTLIITSSEGTSTESAKKKKRKVAALVKKKSDSFSKAEKIASEGEFPTCNSSLENAAHTPTPSSQQKKGLGDLTSPTSSQKLNQKRALNKSEDRSNIDAKE